MIKLCCLFIFSVLIFSSAFSATKPIKVKARFLYCNPYQVSYCHETFAHGDGFGLILFKNNRVAARPGGIDLTAKALMVGELQAIEILALRDDRDQKFVLTKEYIVTGKFESTHSGIIFSVWSVE